MKNRTKHAVSVARWLGPALLVAGVVVLALWWYWDSPHSVDVSAEPDVRAAAEPSSPGSPASDGTGTAPRTGGSVEAAPDRESALDLYRRGEIEEAAAALTAYLEARPDDAEVAAVLAQVQWLRGDALSSADRYEAVIAQKGPDPDLLYQLALVDRSAGRLVEAIEGLGAALELRPQATEFRMELARTLRMTGAGERAAAEWEAVIAALPPDDPARAGSYYELGLAHLAAGDLAAARIAFERGSALRPGDPAFAAQLDALDGGGAGS